MFVSLKQNGLYFVNLTLTMGMVGISEFTTTLRTLATLGKADKPQFFHVWASLVAQMVKNLPAV